MAEAEESWPAIPARALSYRSWIARAEGILAGLPDHRLALADLRKQGTEITRDGEVEWEFEDSGLQWWHDSLAALVDDLGLLVHSSRFVSALRSVEFRLEFAEGLRRRSLEDPAELWSRAIAEIADPAVCPLYRGLRIEPQLGLIPLARNQRSGLWEFAHLGSGPQAAKLDAEGKPDLDDPEAGLVFVLIPGGGYMTGSQSADSLEPFFDENRLGREFPPTHFDLEPFFIGKTELTRAQWIYLCGENPSSYKSRPRVSDVNPIENVSWIDADRTLRRLGLILPTEFQWEVAARAGETTRWWTGAQKESLAGAANLADLTALDSQSADAWTCVEWLRDGYYYHAAVGALRPNGFGLHHVHGNVSEWCLDSRPEATHLPRGWNGLREAAQRSKRVHRGGSFTGGHVTATVTYREILPAQNKSDDLGFRACRRLDR